MGAFNKANADTVKACLISITVYNMCIGQHMMQEKLEEKDKLKVLTEIADEVNSKENAKIDGIENDALVVVSDIEGRAEDFLIKLKHTGVINGVEVDKKTGKLKIHLNENFCGTIDFCGDLTAYKNVRPFGNEIVIEVFEELLEQIKAHNEGKEKDKQIQFVAVPGNHEFYDFWGLQDEGAISSPKDGEKDPLLIKLRSLKVIAEIQKYFLEQVKRNGDDIKDNDYKDTDVNIETRIKLLDNECKMLEIIYDVLSSKGAYLGNDFYDYFINYKDRKEVLQKTKDDITNGCFMIKTKKGRIADKDVEITNTNNKFFGKKCITKQDLKNIFKDEVCYLSFKEILEILKSNKKYKENSGKYTEWTEDLINEKLSDLGKVLDNENFVLEKTTDWSAFHGDLESKITSIKKLEHQWKSFETSIQPFKEKLLQNGFKGKIEDENPISVFRPLFWDKSALLSKIIFNHRGKKFRTLHHFGLFVPKNCPDERLTTDSQNEIFTKAFLRNNQFNLGAIGCYDLRHLKRNIFENNNIPTLFGHEGMWLSDAQTSKMYCVDTGHSDNLNVVCVVDSNNNITPYYTYKCIKLKNEEQKKQNQQNAVELKLGDYDGKKITLAIYDCKLQNNISIINNYVESGQQPLETVVNAIDAIIKSNYTLEDYHRHLAFSRKDRRAQQVYQTYKMLAEQQNEINTGDQQKQNQTMIELNSIHAINTPCGSCL